MESPYLANRFAAFAVSGLVGAGLISCPLARAADNARQTGVVLSPSEPADSARIVSGYATQRQAEYEVRGAAGEVTRQRSTYWELGDGLNYRDAAGIWQRSRAEFLPTSEGFHAPHGPHQVRLTRNLNQAGAVTYQSGEVVLRSAPLALGYFDPVTGASVILARLQDTEGRQVATNVVLYPDSFAELHASVRYTYAQGAFHQDIILHEAPPDPGTLGLSRRSRLEVLTEFAPDTAEPQRKARLIGIEGDPGLRAAMVEPDFADELLTFGEDVRLPEGRAFPHPNSAADGTAEVPTEEIPVGKSFQRIEGRPVLIEGVEYERLLPWLTNLPPTLTFPGAGSSAGGRRVTTARVLPSRTVPTKRGQEWAGRPPVRAGVVLDYVIRSGGVSTFTFLTQATYLITGTFGVGNQTASFQAGTVIKFGTNATLYTYGPLSFPSTGTPVVFTSKDDNLYGELIAGSTGTPTHMAQPALWIYYVDFNTEVRNARFRWAKRAVLYDHNAGVTATHTLRDSQFKHCQTAVVGGFNSPAITLLNLTRCNVTTAGSGCCLAGSIPTDCQGDSDFDDLPDAWETALFGNLNVHDAGGDPDGDGLINFREHLIGTSPVLADTDGDGLNDLLDYELTFNVPVNSAAQDHGKEQNTQFEPTCAVLNGNVIVAYVDSNRGVYELGSTNNSQGYLSGYTPRMAGYSVSQFGGAFFDDKDVPPLSTQGAGTSDDGDAGDPVLAVDSSSNALVYLVATSPRNAGHKGIPFWKSTNGGLTFGTPSLIAGNVTLTDKPWIAVDNFPGVNDGQGTVYVAFATMSAPGKLWLCSSVDRGTNWSSALPIAEAESGGVINCALPVVCSDHSLAVFWYERFANGQSHLRLRKVTNRSNLSAVYPASGNNTLRLNTQDYRLLLRRTENGSTSDTFTAYPFPVPAASPDTNRAGHLYLTWADKGTGSDRADVFFSRSINGGQTWTVPVRLSTTAFNDQWMPVLAVKSDGTKLFAAWYDRRNDPNNSLMELYGRWATVNGDGSVTWGTEFKITTTSFPPVFAGYLPVNRDPGKYDPVYPPSDVNLNWHYPEWPLVDDLGLPVVTSLAYTGHVGEYNFCIGDGPHVHLVWTDYRDLTANTIAVRNQANIRYSRLTW